MAILLTGGAYAKTSQRIATLCRQAKIPFLFASRRGDSVPAADAKDPTGATDAPAVRFDWTDADSYANPFAHAFPNGDAIRAVYMIMPRVPEPDKYINAFIDYAAARGAKRFVLMAGTSASLGGPGPGKVWQHMVEKGVEWAVCRPTWFMDNLSDGFHLKTIREENTIYSCVGEAKVPFVNSLDVGGVAYAALTQPEPPNKDFRIVGPALLTHDDVAARLGNVLGRPIRHVNMSPEERLEHMTNTLKLPAQYAGFMVSLEKLAAGGAEDYMDDTVEKLTGRKPVDLDSFIKERKELWQ
ncbi:nucleoside-diphosphate-sugar epimerase family protein [Metarhizium album ARSEF 1941]|uniref:Nucleoside-diphosphate-sugar epimerase family protein n=1 Tax=Metarhizium album (strain ARSEF 1941) TaxID=1081103 RepID=A0A0B2WLS3_METAS|nr:nucleoside-diphosphate-sugar epimerase family protein [Metarhizium album ARSEF 1941]KHN94883.1 nucleoside-diphosphate-sugar epimerase family protein [Metarhizium album ARSEF 1941]